MAQSDEDPVVVDFTIHCCEVLLHAAATHTPEYLAQMPRGSINPQEDPRCHRRERVVEAGGILWSFGVEQTSVAWTHAKIPSLFSCTDMLPWGFLNLHQLNTWCRPKKTHWQLGGLWKGKYIFFANLSQPALSPSPTKACSVWSMFLCKLVGNMTGQSDYSANM